MNSRLLITALASFFMLSGGAASADPAATAAPMFDDVIRDYLLTHPKVLRQALQNMQEQERADQMAALQANIRAHQNEIYDTATAIEAGNPRGDVTVVEFLDYNCVYCKAVAPNIAQAVKEDGKVRVLYKMLPILGENSMFAANLVLAAKTDGTDKQLKLHEALIGLKAQVTQETALRAAKEIGIDVERAQKIMAQPDFAAPLKRTIELGQTIGIASTPTFLVNEQVLAGALPTAAFAHSFEIARSSKR